MAEPKPPGTTTLHRLMTEIPKVERHLIEAEDLQFLLRGGSLRLFDGHEIALADIDNARIARMVRTADEEPALRKCKQIGALWLDDEQRLRLPLAHYSGPWYGVSIAPAAIFDYHEARDSADAERLMSRYFTHEQTLRGLNFPTDKKVGFAIYASSGEPIGQNDIGTKFLQTNADMPYVGPYSTAFRAVWLWSCDQAIQNKMMVAVREFHEAKRT